MRVLVYQSQLIYDPEKGDSYYHGVVSFWYDGQFKGFKKLDNQYNLKSEALREAKKYCETQKTIWVKTQPNIGKILIKQQNEQNKKRCTHKRYTKFGSCVGFRYV